uniref:KIND domain-containing protein n=1 Tax=Serinus canaria TaxID=9135 RepID=A0A8C9ME12_SERCA
MEPAGIPKVSLAELLSCFEEPVSEEQAWAICFQCCRKIEQLASGSNPPFLPGGRERERKQPVPVIARLA